MSRICEMVGVREHTEKFPGQLWRHENGRLVVIARNEAGYNSTEVDLLDLIAWLQNGNCPEDLPNGRTGFAVEFHAERDCSDV